jgi:transcriptional regulator PpsR
VKPFKLPKKSLGDLDADIAAKLIAASADLALVVDKKGVIKDLAFDNSDLARDGFEAWIGRPLIETVTVESRPKIEELLRDAGAKAAPRWRQVNHPTARGRDVPIRYAAFEIGREGKIVVVGRDLRAMSTLQQQLVDAQQQMEREFTRLRHAEMRYRAVFHLSGEAVLIIDAATQKVIEANPRATELFSRSARKVISRSVGDLFDRDASSAIETMIAGLRSSPRVADMVIAVPGYDSRWIASASLIRQETSAFVLLRLSAAEAEALPRNPGGDALQFVPQFVEAVPHGFVIADKDWRILTANPAFLEYIQLATLDQARGESLERWIGRSGVDLDVLRSNVRERGMVRRFSTVLRGEFGTRESVDITALTMPGSSPPVYGIMIRKDEMPEPAAESHAVPGMARSVEQMTELVGRVPLKDLVRDTTDIIEKLCIEAALQLTGDNRASAAEILGLSRQSLYIKLRKYGLGDLDRED